MELRNFFNNHNKLPTSMDHEFESILGAIKRGYWKKMRIQTWNDLLLNVFENVNKIQGKWTRKEGFKRALNAIFDFYNQNKRCPTNRDLGMSSIATTCKRGYYKDFKINSWGELKQFGKNSLL